MWARSVERSRRVPQTFRRAQSPKVGSRCPDATHSPRRPRLLDTGRVPLPTPKTTTCLTFRTDACSFMSLLDVVHKRGSRGGASTHSRLASHQAGATNGYSASSSISSSQLPPPPPPPLSPPPAPPNLHPS